MMIRVVCGLLLALQGAHAILSTANSGAFYSAILTLPEGEMNHLNFFFTGSLQWREYIGVFVNTHTCANTATNDPILEISPSVNLSPSNTAFLASPQKTSGFGGIGSGNYRLCYCNFDNTQSFQCNRTTYTVDVGKLYMFDMPNTFQNKAAPQTAFTLSYAFLPKSSTTTILTTDRYMAIDSSAASTSQCGVAMIASAWSNAATSGLLSAAPLVDTTAGVSTWTPPLSSTITAGIYKVCYCSATLLQSSCPTTTSANYQNSFPYQVGEILIHDLLLYYNGITSSTLIASQANNITMAFQYTSPSSILTANGKNSFW